MSKQRPTLADATLGSLVVMFVAGLTLTHSFLVPWLHLILLFVYLIFPIRWILVRLVRERFFRGLGIALSLAVLQTGAGCIGFLLWPLLLSSVTGTQHKAAGFMLLIAMVLAMYVSAAHVLVYVPIVALASFVRWMKEPDPEPPPPEIELGEQPGWDEGGNPNNERES